MASAALPQVEILVHVSAASTTAHDAVYRQLAHAYLSFEPARCVSVSDDGGDDVPGGADEHLPSEPPETRPTRPPSPHMHTPLPSQVCDSYPMPDLSLVETTPTTVLERFRGNDSSSLPSTYHEPNTTVLDSLPRRLIRDVIPVTPSSMLRKRKTRPDEQDTPIYDITHISNSSLGSSSSLGAPWEPPPTSEPYIQQVDDYDDLARSSHPADIDTSSSDFTAIDITADCITAPPPPLGITSITPADLIPDTLARLAHQLSSRFRPVSSRLLTDPYERGYWLVDCSLWPPDDRHAMWTFLANYIGSGVAGWGVWCCRCPKGSSSTHKYSLRLYCWASVVKHMYLLLYLASGRRLKTTHAAWIDADGQTVFMVPPSNTRRA